MSALPYIIVPELNCAKFMLDTGSTCSFICNKLANQCLRRYKYNEPFELISTHGVSRHNEAISMPTFEIFKQSSDSQSKFYVYDIDDFYDGLIGINLLKQLNASIDFENNVLSTSDVTIPIYIGIAILLNL